MAEYSKILRGTFTSTGAAKFLSLPMVPDTIEVWNKTKWATTTNHTGVSAIGFAEDSAGTAYITESNGTTWLGKTITSGGFTFISAGSPTFGPVTTSAAGTPVSKANPAVVHSVAHGLVTGDVVWIYGTTAMLQIAGIPYVVTVTGVDDFTIAVDSSGFANTATSVSWKKLLYPDLYIPELCYITAISTGVTTTITTSINHNFVVGQEVGFTIPTQWGMTQLDSAVWLQTHFQPQQAIVTAVGAVNQITVNVNSTGYTAFAYPTTTVAALGVTFPQVYALGDQNSGYTALLGAPPYLGVKNGIIGIPGSFAANTRQGVIVGTGDGTEIIHATSDVIAWRAIFPDAVLLNQ